MSMQDLADEAKVSVGLIYKYFGGKEDLLLATIVGSWMCSAINWHRVIAAAGDDVVDQLTAGVRRYVQIVDENLDGVVLTYRESRTLGAPGRAQIKDLEIASAAPLRAVIEDGIAQGIFRAVDVDLIVFDIMLLAHGWALKHWHFGTIYSIDQYIALQTRHVLTGLITDDRRADYAHVLK